MDYGSLIREAWSITWRHRFLWVLGLFAATSVGTCSGGGWSGGGPLQWSAQPGDFERFSPGAGDAATAMADGVSRWVTDNLALIVLVALAAFLLGLAFLIVSLIAQGGMARATADLAQGRPITGGQAWRAGRQLFWRYLGLWLLLIGAAIAIAAIVGFFAALGIGAGMLASGGARIALVVLGVLAALLAVLVAIPLFILASIIIAYAQRAIAVEDAGPLAALRCGMVLLRSHLGTSLLIWLINLALSIGAGIAIAVAMSLVFMLLAIVGVLFYAAAGLSAPLIVYTILALLVAMAVFWLLAAIANSYFWSYWTLAYLRLSERPGP